MGCKFKKVWLQYIKRWCNTNLKINWCTIQCINFQELIWEYKVFILNYVPTDSDTNTIFNKHTQISMEFNSIQMFLQFSVFCYPEKNALENNWKHLLATQFLIVCSENLSKQFDLHSFHVHIEIFFYSVN